MVEEESLEPEDRQTGDRDRAEVSGRQGCPKTGNTSLQTVTKLKVRHLL